MDIKELRELIDGADRQLTDAFARRMEISEMIAAYKRENGLPVRDAVRERAKLDAAAHGANERLAPYIEELYTHLIDMSRRYQSGADAGRRLDNIVLIGMPGCGKTSIGRRISELTGRPFADTDDEIVRREGMEIKDIFAQKGEGYFRDIESKALDTVIRSSGIVIATGGGIILREENRALIRRHALVILIERDIEMLPIAGRPLSEGRGVCEIYAERAPLYRALADDIFRNDTSADDVAAAIADKWLRV